MLGGHIVPRADEIDAGIVSRISGEVLKANGRWQHAGHYSLRVSLRVVSGQDRSAPPLKLRN